MGSPMNIWGSLINIWGLQWKSVVYNEYLGVSNKNMGSTMNIWGSPMKICGLQWWISGGSLINICGLQWISGGLQWKSVVSNKYMGSPMKNFFPGSTFLKVWDIIFSCSLVLKMNFPEFCKSWPQMLRLVNLYHRPQLNNTHLKLHIFKWRLV